MELEVHRRRIRNLILAGIRALAIAKKDAKIDCDFIKGFRMGYSIGYGVDENIVEKLVVEVIESLAKEGFLKKVGECTYEIVRDKVLGRQ